MQYETTVNGPVANTERVVTVTPREKPKENQTLGKTGRETEKLKNTKTKPQITSQQELLW